MKTLCIVTRCHPKRPNMLKICVGSVKRQTGNDYTHLLVKSDKTENGYGVAKANEAISTIKIKDAKYVMVLDDDDFFIDYTFVDTLKKIADKSAPDIVMFKGVIPPYGILPQGEYWKKPPVRGKIGSFCFAVSMELWNKYVEFWRPSDGYVAMSDFTFIRECYKNTESITWMDKVVACTQFGASRGRGECQIAQS